MQKMSTDDNLSGVRDITLPDGSIVDAAQAKYTVDKNGVYNLSLIHISAQAYQAVCELFLREVGCYGSRSA